MWKASASVPRNPMWMSCSRTCMWVCSAGHGSVSVWIPGRSWGKCFPLPTNRKASTMPATTTTPPAMTRTRFARRRRAALRLRASRCRRASSLRACRFGAPASVGRSAGACVLGSAVAAGAALVADDSRTGAGLSVRDWLGRDDVLRDCAGGRQVLPFFVIGLGRSRASYRKRRRSDQAHSAGVMQPPESRVCMAVYRPAYGAADLEGSNPRPRPFLQVLSVARHCRSLVP